MPRSRTSAFSASRSFAVADDDEVKAGECGRRHRLKRRKLWAFLFGQPRDSCRRLLHPVEDQATTRIMLA